MGCFIAKNKGKLIIISLIIILIATIYKHFPNPAPSESLALAFVVWVLSIFLITSVHCENESIEYVDNEIDLSNKDVPAPESTVEQVDYSKENHYGLKIDDSPITKEEQELVDAAFKGFEEEFGNMDVKKAFKDMETAPIAPKNYFKLKQKPMAKPEKTSGPKVKNIEPETNENQPVSEKPKVEGVKSYSLHNVHQKWRQMYQDVCSFATTGEPKTEEQLIGKIIPWGYQYETIRKDGLVAFVVKSGFGNQRLPESGFFEVSK